MCFISSQPNWNPVWNWDPFWISKISRSQQTPNDTISVSIWLHVTFGHWKLPSQHLPSFLLKFTDSEEQWRTCWWVGPYHHFTWLPPPLQQCPGSQTLNTAVHGNPPHCTPLPSLGKLGEESNNRIQKTCKGQAKSILARQSTRFLSRVNGLTPSCRCY